MKKRILVLLMVAVIAFSVVFTACNKDVYTDPLTDSEYILVTDENGNKVLSEDGELLVYVTDVDGKKVKDDEGNYVTEIHGFVGQIEQKGVVEDYAYYFTLPSGWKTVNDQGEFINKSKGYTLTIDIEDETFNDYLKESKDVYEAFSSDEAKEASEVPLEIYWDEYEFDNISTKAYLLSFKIGEVSTFTMFFSSNDNLYVLRIEHEGEVNFEEAKAEMIKIYEGLKFKPYTYYEGLTDAPTEAEETTEKIEETTKAK